MYDVRYDNPLKQGLKLSWRRARRSPTRVRYDNPLKQGLKPEARLPLQKDRRVRYDNPLKQGLKHCPDCGCPEIKLSDMTIH